MLFRAWGRFWFLLPLGGLKDQCVGPLGGQGYASCDKRYEASGSAGGRGNNQNGRCVTVDIRGRSGVRVTMVLQGCLSHDTLDIQGGPRS